MYEYDFHTYSVRRKRSTNKIVFSFLGVCIVLVFLTWFIFGNKSENKSQIEQKVLSIANEEINADSKLGIVVRQALIDTTGEYSIVVKHLQTDEIYSLNAHETYDAGSLYKLWVMAEVFEQIKEGKISEDEELATNIEELNKKFRIASDAAELTEGEINFTIGSALRQMITISHNYAALSLTEKVRLTNVKNFLTDNGFNESKVGTDGSSPTTTASDIALFLEKLYKEELADSLSSEKMLDLLKSQQLNNKLPKYLPESTLIAHKTGEIGEFSHDAGIVYTTSGEYIIVVLSKSDYPPGAEERIAEISRAVYEYFAH
jgi:beta-lactamase class A